MKKIQVGNETYKRIKLRLNKMRWRDHKIAVQDRKVFLHSYLILEFALSAEAEKKIGPVI